LTCSGERSPRPASADGAIVITGAANTAAKARVVLEMRMDKAFKVHPIWRHMSIRI
jgi:hypothetical protein